MFPATCLGSANSSLTAVFYETYLLFQVMGKFNYRFLQGGFQAMEYK
jgi:hypothetical protein